MRLPSPDSSGIPGTSGASLALDDLTSSRLAARPLYRGQIVPAVVEWAPAGNVKPVQVDAEWGFRVTCRCTPGTGTPRLGVFCPRTQGELMQRRLCQICGSPFGPGETLWMALSGAPYHREPPFHTGCGVYAMFVCPALRAAQDQDAPDRLTITSCASYSLYSLLRGISGAPESRPHPLVMTPAGTRRYSSPDNPVPFLYARPKGPQRRYTAAQWRRLAVEISQ